MYAMNSTTWNRAQRTREQRRADVVKQRQLAEAARRRRAQELREKLAAR